jgi:hypothetical protein
LLVVGNIAESVLNLRKGISMHVHEGIGPFGEVVSKLLGQVVHEGGPDLSDAMGERTQQWSGRVRPTRYAQVGSPPPD